MKRRRSDQGDAGHHPNSIYYKNPPDFKSLAEQYPEFANHVLVSKSGTSILDWNDPDALLALTKVLLKHDFHLKFSIPRHHLCPPVSQRLNYILWVEDLLKFLPKSDEVVGIDIGTGASAIFALLGTSRSINFVCTETDAESVQSARDNIANNNLQDKIEVIHVDDPNKILAGVLPENREFDFCICNPPFFDSLEETGLNNKRVCLATASELICEGGEFRFIKQLLDESAGVLKGRIGWYTTMLGRKVTLAKLLPLIHATNPVCVQTTVFKQGRQSRWGLAWTYRNDIAVKLDCRKIDDHLELKYNFMSERKSIETIHLLVNEWIRSRSGKIVKKSPLSIIFSLSIDDASAVSFKMNFMPLQPNQFRISIDIQCDQADQLVKQLTEMRAELESILT